MKRPGSPIALLLVAALALAGCRAQRELRIRSDPSGATVRLDDLVVGETPLTVPFDNYGVRRVTLYADGFRTTSRKVRVKTPWYSIFPLDLVSEVLLPFGWADVHRVELQLEAEVGEVSEAELRAVLERAEVLRRAGPAGPQTAPVAARPGASGPNSQRGSDG